MYTCGMPGNYAANCVELYQFHSLIVIASINKKACVIFGCYVAAGVKSINILFPWMPSLKIFGFVCASAITGGSIQRLFSK